jgi:hypothetical protein
MDFQEGTVQQVLRDLQDAQGIQESPQQDLGGYVVFEDLME